MIESCAEPEAVIKRFRNKADLCENEEPEDTDGDFVIPARERKRWWCVRKAISELLSTLWDQRGRLDVVFGLGRRWWNRR